MKRFTERDLLKYIQQEVEKKCISEGFITDPNPIVIMAADVIKFQPSKKESDEIKIEDVKALKEEFARMKSLVDFRSPLLKRD